MNLGLSINGNNRGEQIQHLSLTLEDRRLLWQAEDSPERNRIDFSMLAGFKPVNSMTGKVHIPKSY